MPGLELFSSINAAVANTTQPSTHTPSPVSEEAPQFPAPASETTQSSESSEVAPVPRGLASPTAYYNPRLDPKNFLEGPLSWNPATRLRQMLARPGIVVCHFVVLPVSALPDGIISLQIAPGICDGISARCALEAGFDCLYQRCGLPDGLAIPDVDICMHTVVLRRRRRALACRTWRSPP